MEGSWHQLANSVTLIFTIQTYISCSRPTSSVAREMPLWPFPSLLLFAWCSSPQLWLVQPVLPHDNILLQRLRTDTGDRSFPSAGEQQVTLLCRRLGGHGQQVAT